MAKNEKLQKELARQILQEGVPAQNPAPKKGLGTAMLALVFVLVALLLVVVIFLVGTIVGGGLFNRPTPLDELGQFAENDPTLPKTADAGAGYVEETVFIGDSNTVRYAMFGLVPEQRVLAKDGIGIGAVRSYRCVNVGGSDVTIETAVETLRPVRAVIMLGTNDLNGLEVDEFIAEYKKVLSALRSASPKTEWVVAGVPPIAENTSYYGIEKSDIDAFNKALKQLCWDEAVPYLDTADALAGEDGYAKPGYTDFDGLHLSEEAMRALLACYRTHAWRP